MRKTLIFLSLLFTVTADASAKNNPTNALHGIIEKFESLSRITNGLALQKELNSKSLKIDHLLAEILGINPENNGFEELRKFKMDDLSKRYAKISTDAGTVKKSNIDESMVKSQLDVLGKMGEDLEVLKSGEYQNVDEIVEKGKKIFEMRVTSISGIFNTFPRALNKTFNLKDGRSDENEFKSSFKLLSEVINDFRDKALNDKMTETKVHWRSFKTKIDIIKVKKSLDLVEGASHHVMDISSFQTLQLSSSEVERCLKDLTQISVDVDFEQLNKMLNQLESIEKAALELKPLLVEFSEISVLENETMFNAFESDLGQIDHTLNYMGLQQEADRLRAKPEYKDLLEGFLTANEIIGKIENIGIRNLLIRKIQKWDALSKAKVVLNGTSLIETLECLQQKKFDATGISKLLTFGSMIRSIGDEYKKDKSMETFIGQVDQFQKSLRNLAASVRPKRSPSNSTVDSFQNGLIVAQDLSKGVDLLRKMGNLYGKKKDLDMVVAGGKEVFQEFQNIIASVDTEKLESEMKKTSEIFRSLIMGEFFENASTIHGVSIDSKLLQDPVAASFEKSSNQKIRSVAVPLKTLGSLQLDFSNGRSDFKSAQLSLSKLQEYFDQVFSIQRKSHNAESDPLNFKTIGIYGGSGLIFIATLIGFIFLARCIVDDRKRSDPNYYIHLLDSGDESVLTTSKMMAVATNFFTFIERFDGMI
ncbi:hypothetical protein L3Y34_017169 [Caenorhabditis briggsae]|uniref:Domain of unknown function WSN domain-containing protein n=1 Tax=Caenorhabditis briggsae TaxID=6238 RepID=A0AAE9DGR4_CAEBR|nr:hypothetical protein L3Y34_017169 [Caenorhabditis briggsae]